MDENDLVEVARGLVSAVAAPQDASLRRALSTAYYAIFHALARNNADTLIGERDATNEDAWGYVYRALDHGPAKDRCQSARVRRLGPEIVKFANAFVLLQQKRHAADYNPFFIVSRRDVLLDLVETRASIDALAFAPFEKRRAFAAFVLLKERP